MDERRQYPRQQASMLLEVFEALDGQPLGRVVDLSQEGFMLSSPLPQYADSLVACRLTWSPAIDGVDQITFSADCLWARGGENGQQSWGGYHIIDIDESNANALQALLEHLQASD